MKRNQSTAIGQIDQREGRAGRAGARLWICLICMLTVVSMLVTSCGLASTSSEQVATTAATAAGAMGYAAETTNRYDTADIGTGAYSVSAPDEQVGISFSEAATPAENSYSDSKSKGEARSVPVPTMPDLGRKMILEGQATMQTLDYDGTIQALYRMITAAGGFIESQNLQGSGLYGQNTRYATIVFRVPSEKFTDAFNGLGSIGSVVSSSSWGTDITDQYVDSETRAKNLRVQEERLLVLISKAAKIEEIVTLEQRLSEVRTEIESLENTLKNYDRLLEYSRITLSIEEGYRVQENRPVPKTLGERIAQAFGDAWRTLVEDTEDLLVWTVENMFTLMIWAIVLVAVWLFIRRQIRRGRRGDRSASRRSRSAAADLPLAAEAPKADVGPRTSDSTAGNGEPQTGGSSSGNGDASEK